MTTASDDVRLRGRTRWSMASRCARMASYGLIGTEPDPISPAQARLQRRLFRRGRRIGDEVMDDFSEKYGEENIIREHASVWPDEGLPLGELHADGFVIPEKMAVEVKSSTSPSSILDSAIVQLGGEIRWNPDAEIGCLAIADPTGSNETELLPVILTDELTERVEGIAAQVVESARTGELPPRVCSKPSDARGRMCPFAATCFEGWQAPDPLDLSEDIAQLAVDLKQAQDEERVAKQAIVLAETRRKEIAAQLSGWELVPGMDYLGNGIKLKRTKVDDSPRFSYSKAVKAGVFSSPIWTPEHEALISPFLALSGGHDRWKVDVVSESSAPKASGDEWGETAPWDDADLEGTLGNG